MKNITLGLLSASLLLAPAVASAEKVLATVKVSTKALSATGFATGNIAYHQNLQQQNHEEALAQLKAEAARLQAATPGAVRHELAVTKVKHDVLWSHASPGFSKGDGSAQRERFTTVKMSGEVRIFGN